MFIDSATASLTNGSLRLCYLDGDARTHSSSFYTATLTASVIIAVFSPVTVVGNVLIMAVIWKNPSLGTPSYILLCCLAFTDLCTGLITQPFQVTANLLRLGKPQAIREHLPLIRTSRSIVEGSASFFYYINCYTHYAYVCRKMVAHDSSIFTDSPPYFQSWQ